MSYRIVSYRVVCLFLKTQADGGTVPIIYYGDCATEDLKVTGDDTDNSPPRSLQRVEVKDSK